MKAGRHAGTKAPTARQRAPVTRRASFSRCKRLSGFTLLEVLIAVLLIGISATLVGLQLQGNTEQARLNAAVTRIESSLRLAKQHARTRHRTVFLAPQMGSDRLLVSYGTSKETRDVAHQLDGVLIEQVKIGETAGLPASTEPLRVRVTSAGICSPWMIRLRAGTRAETFLCDGIHGRLARVESDGKVAK